MWALLKGTTTVGMGPSGSLAGIARAGAGLTYPLSWQLWVRVDLTGPASPAARLYIIVSCADTWERFFVIIIIIRAEPIRADP